jgi:hypothetical protein
MQITEPVTMLTDYALGAVNLFFAISTFNRMDSSNRVSGLLLLLGFSFQAISAFIGGTFHGFATHFDAAALRGLWNLTLLSIGATVGFLGGGIHSAHIPRENGKWIVAAVVVALVGVAVQVSGFRARQAFNHNDVFHLIVIVSMYLFFKGCRTLQDRGYSPR